MAHIKLFLAVILLAVSCSSDSQNTAKDRSLIADVFRATTPYTDTAKRLLNISSDTRYAMMRWKLELYHDAATFGPATFKLAVTYGMDKQGSRDFMPGAQTIEWKGSWILEKTFTNNDTTTVYTLTDETSSASLSFMQIGPNLLHLLDNDGRLVIGTGAWSYTLSRVDPVPAASSKFSMRSASLQPLKGDSAIVGVFDGRSPCNDDILTMNGISSDGCQIIKYRLILYQDVNSHTPSTFLLYTVYVGKGNNRYNTTGKWTTTEGTAINPHAIVYQLQPDTGKPQTISFMKGDDNILFMLDTNMRPLVGNEYASFTLNRNMK